MSAHDKIVRLEQIEADDQADIDDASLKYVHSAPALYEQDYLLSLPEDVPPEQCGSSTNQELVPADEAPAIPAEWPRIPQLAELHSWDFTTAVSPSINKAVGHLELLQTIIEEWLENIRKQEIQKAKRALNRSAGGPRQQLRFHGSASETQVLSIQGMGAFGAPSSTSSRLSPDQSEFPYLGAEEVVDETMRLLAKLETDRQETLAKLAQERERVKTLGEKIDKLAEKRLLDIPGAVQKEHESCAKNITELNWSVAYKQKNKTQLETRVTVASALNEKLKADVEFVHSHIPLVNEKLELEQDAMQRIEAAQEETNAELRITEEQHKTVKEKAEELHQMAEKERAAMKKDLDGVRRDLKNINAELEEAKQQYQTLVGSCEYCEKRLVSDETELQVLLVKQENAKSKESMEATKLKDLKEQIVAAEYEHGKHAKFIDELSREMSGKLDENHSIVFTDRISVHAAANATLRKQLENEIKRKTERLRALSRHNKEMEIDIEDMQHKIKECIKQKERDEKNLVRMHREVDRTARQVEVTDDELGQAHSLDALLHEQLRMEEDKCCHQEEELRSTMDHLKRQVKDEIHNRTVLVARINSDTTESERFELEVNEKIHKANKKWEEVQAAVTKVLAKVEKYRKEVEAKQKLMRELQEKVNDFKEAHEVMEKVKTEEMMALTPIHESLRKLVTSKPQSPPPTSPPSKAPSMTDVSNLDTGEAWCEEKQMMVVTNLDTRLDYMEKKTEVMNTKMDDMKAQSRVMRKSFINTNRQVDNLKELQDELSIQMEKNKKLDDEVVANIDDITARTNQRSKAHRDLMQQRQMVHKEQENELAELLRKNEELAKKYRQLQNAYIQLKNEVLNMYQGKLQSEDAIRDIRQLQSLQKKLQAALLEYFKYRGLYNQAELTRLENNSTANKLSVGQIKNSMDTCLAQVASFLTNQFHPDSIHKMAMDKVAHDEALEKGLEKAIAEQKHKQQPIAG